MAEDLGKPESVQSDGGLERKNIIFLNEFMKIMNMESLIF
jgi:hypothetical protein